MSLTFFPYIGGKNYIVNWILKFIPEHEIYVEPFGGSGAVLLNKKPSKIEVYNDIDNKLVILFKTLQDENKSQKLLRKLKYTLYSRTEFENAKQIINNINQYNDIEIAWATYILLRFSIISKINSPSFASNKTKNNAKIYFNSLKNLITIRERLKNVIIENLNWNKCIELYDSEKTLFYVDPPYPKNITSGTKIYMDEFNSNEKIITLLEKLKNAKGMIILSGYENELYDKILNNWHKFKKKIKVKSLYAKPNITKTETLYIKPNTPLPYTIPINP